MVVVPISECWSVYGPDHDAVERCVKLAQKAQARTWNQARQKPKKKKKQEFSPNIHVKAKRKVTAKPLTLTRAEILDLDVPPPPCDDCAGVCPVPVWNSQGDVVAYTIIDCDQYPTYGIQKWTYNTGYAVRYQRGGIVSLHRQILSLATGNPLVGDHYNWDKLDNRRCNLRPLTRDQNLAHLPAGIYWNAKSKRMQGTLLQQLEKPSREFVSRSDALMKVMEEDAYLAYVDWWGLEYGSS